ncbi:MAG: class I adenylate cyclase [Desulfobacteraceae bacterium]|nr:class I adenylate cyclase [Desulfobacteraceae bacterium]
MINKKNITFKDFDFTNFDKNWDLLDQNQQCQMLENVSELTPSQAIQPIIAGLLSYHYLLRNKAREAIEIIQSKMIKALNSKENKTLYLKAIEESACFCSKIFLLIKPGMPLSELNFYFQTLIKSGGQGPFYAWKTCFSGMISMQAFNTITQALSEKENFILTDQYLQSSPQVRRKWALSFKKILRTIKSKKEIVSYLSNVFDNNKGVDPFMFNISLLRNIDHELLNDLHSPDETIRETTLKAVFLIHDALDSEFIINRLENEKNNNIRVVLLKIIEFSSIGTYPHTILTDCLLNIFKKHNVNEAFHAFKALVVTKGIPLYKLIAEVLKFRQDILIEVLEEISSFSRISFLLIQDVAQNKKEYFKHNALVFKAFILGIVRKRPERVINILKKFENYPDELIRDQVSEFIDKINQLLEKQKGEIEEEIKSLISTDGYKPEPKSGFFKGFFFSETDKKLVELKESSIPREFNFEKELIEDIDLSSLKLLNYIICFNSCAINNSSFSQSVVENSSFQSSILYNVDFSNSEFDSVCFDNAVLININANNSKFINCSFCKALIYNSSFEDSDLLNSVFTGSKIIKTSFDKADLSGVSFAASKFTFTSFIDSIFTVSDFTGVQSRYSKFDDFLEDTVITNSADFNARTLKINLDSIPMFNEEIISRIEMLVFIEFLHYGEKVFLKKNKLSKLIAFDIYKKNQGDLFELIPLLLHENIDLPNALPKGKSLVGKSPYGIAKYLPSRETEQIAKKYLRIKNFKLRKNQNSYIEGLYTIGSTGSLAQTIQSDFDFWVVIKDELFTKEMKESLESKLTQIEKWADKEFNTEVNFFLLDINKAINNDFGTLTFESSGSAQARLLKEEFYRTIIYVAGKLPLWTVLPVSISVNYYNDINNLVLKSSLSSKYIDLGDIHGIPSGEYFGASIWHMYKLLRSPFKSVIKMALLEKFIHGYGKQPLLCNKLKDSWINSGNQLKLTSCDSYYILIQELIKYYKSIEDTKSVNLIQICFFLKVQISKSSDFINTLFGIRELLINRLVQDWGIRQEQIFEIGNYKNWDYKAIERLSSTIENYMIGKMRMMNDIFENIFQNESKITPEERTVLVRNIVVEFSKEKGKIERVLLVSRNYTYFQRVNLQYKEVNNKGTWELIVDPKKGEAIHKEPLKSAGTIEEIGAWLINNSFYTEKSIADLYPNPTFVTHNDIVRLMREMYNFFNPIMQKQKSFKSLLLKAEIVAVFVSVNLCADRRKKKITEYSVVYMNSWNEMFIATQVKTRGFDSIEAVAKKILLSLGLEKFPRKKVFFFP